MPRYRRRAMRAKKVHDYVWVTSMPTAVTLADGTTDIQQILASTDWEANATNFERGTMVRIRGQVAIKQPTSATANPVVRMALVLANIDFAAGSFEANTVADYDLNDVLWNTTIVMSQVSDDLGTIWDSVKDVDVKVKRKITSNSALFFVASMGSDASTPTLVIAQTWRILVDRA